MKKYKTYLEEADEKLRSLMVMAVNIEQHYRDNAVVVTHKFKQHDTGLIDVTILFKWIGCKVSHTFRLTRTDRGFLLKECVFASTPTHVDTFLDITNKLDKIIFRTEANFKALQSWEAEH